MNPAPTLTPEQSAFLRPFWLKFAGPPWVVSLGFYAFVAVVRFVAILSPYDLAHIFFLQTVAMWASPFLFLTQNGRSAIGLAKNVPAPSTLLLNALAGAACGLIFFRVGMVVYGVSPDNWCISVRNYLHIDEMRGIFPPAALFALYTVPAIFLNPIGEELLFRGFMQQAFAQRFNSIVATAVSSVLFGALYLCIHGVWIDPAGFHCRIGSATLALFLMATVGVVFTLCRKLTRSLWPAMMAHAAFNLAILGCAIIEFAR